MRPALANRLALAAAATALIAWFLVVSALRPGVVADEQTHFAAAVSIARGQWLPGGWLPMAPGFHAFLGAILYAGGESLPLARGVCTVLALIALVLWNRAARLRHPELAPAKTLLFALNPLWLPFSALVYTEAPSVLAVGAAALLHRRNHRVAAAVTLVAGAAVRQSNLFWALLFAAWAMIEDSPAKPPATDPAPTRSTDGATIRAWCARLRGAWPYFAVLALLALAVAVDPAGLLRPTSANQLKFNPAQIYLYVLIVAVLQLPLWLAEARQRWRARYAPALAHGWVAGGLLTAVGLVMLVFDNPHPWNGDPNYLRNVLLSALDAQLWIRAIASALIVAALVLWWGFLAAQPAPAHIRTVSVLGLVFVGLHWLAEPRYAILPLMLTTLALCCERRVLWWMVAWNAVLSIAACTYVALNGGTQGGVL